MFCRNCGKELTGSPEICPNCGAKLMTGTGDMYDPAFDLSSLSDEQRSEFGQHQFTATFPTAAVIVLYCLTLGLFVLIYFGLKYCITTMIKSR